MADSGVDRPKFAEKTLAPLAMAIGDMLGELRTTAPTVIAENDVTDLVRSLKTATAGWVISGDMAPVSQVLGRIEVGGQASGDAGRGITTAVQWMRDDIEGKTPQRSNALRSQQSQTSTGEPSQWRPPAKQPDQGPYISARALREQTKGPRREYTDKELYELAAQQKKRRGPRRFVDLSPAKLAGGGQNRVNVGGEDEDQETWRLTS